METALRHIELLPRNQRLLSPTITAIVSKSSSKLSQVSKANQLILVALLLLNSRSWTIQVGLQKEKGGVLSWKKKYRILCNIAGPGDIDFKVESLVAIG